MTSLQFADAKPREHLGVLLYGPEGCGKSTGAASAPGPIIYANADRPGAIRFARRLHPDKGILELPVDSRRPLEDLFVALRDREFPDVQTVVLDSLGRIYDVVLADIAVNDKKPTLPERGDANVWIERYVLALLELNVHVVLVAHDNPVVTSGNEEQGTAEIELFPFTGTGNPNLAKKIMRALDIVAYCGRRTVEEGDEEREEFIAQLYAAGGRRAKETTGVLERVEPLDLTDWIGRVNAVYQATPDPAATAATETTGKSKTKERVK